MHSISKSDLIKNLTPTPILFFKRAAIARATEQLIAVEIRRPQPALDLRGPVHNGSLEPWPQIGSLRTFSLAVSVKLSRWASLVFNAAMPLAR